MENKILSIIVTAYNEEKTVAAVLINLQNAFPDAELILVDNGSTDKTVAIATQVPQIKIYSEYALGKGNAIRTGVANANGDYVMFHDADLEYNSHDATEVLNLLKIDRMILGTRYVSMANIPFSSWLANKIISTLLFWRFGVRLEDALTGTRVLHRQTFLSLQTNAHGFNIETEIDVKCMKNKIEIMPISIRYKARTKLEGKKIRPRHLFLLVKEIFK